MGRDVKVQVKGLLEEGGGDVAGMNADCYVQEVNVSVEGFEFPLNIVVAVHVGLEAVPIVGVGSGVVIRYPDTTNIIDVAFN